MSLLEVKNISKRFGGLTAVNEVSFGVNGGEIVGLIGPNGAGKTTLFNVIAGFYRPSAGEVLFQGRPISHLKPHQICRSGIARTFQLVKPLSRISTFDNVVTSSFLRNHAKPQAEAAARKVLKFTGLDEDRQVLAKVLPLGKRKRLEIARAMATQPQLLLLDESFAGLNPTELNESLELIGQIRAQGVTILIIEHHMKVIMSLCNRIVVLKLGQKLAEGTPQEISQNPQVIEAYLGKSDHV